MDQIKNDESIIPIISPSLKDISENKIESHQVVASYWKAPLPPPDILKKYEEIHPGFANRLLSLVEKQSDNRHELDKIHMNGNFRTQQRGQILGCLSVISAIIGGVMVSIFGHPVGGGSLSLTGLAALALTFIYPRGFRKKSKSSDQPNG